jgi:plastocyanin
VRKRRNWLVCLTVAAGVLLGSVSVAVASFHEQKVDEVQLASPSSASAQFVELFDSGGPTETFPGFASPYGLAIFDGAGHPLGSQTLNGTKMSAARAAGRPYLVSTGASDGASGTAGDEVLTVPLPGGSGQACYTAGQGHQPYSCLTWGCVAKPVDAGSGTGSAGGAVPSAGNSAQRQSDDTVQIAPSTPGAPNRTGQKRTACATAKPPAFKGARLLTQHAPVSTSGRVRLKFACSSTAVAHCTARVTLTIAGGRIGSAVLGKWTKTTSRVIAVKRSAFADHKSHRVSVSLRARDAAGRTKTTHDAVTLRLPAAKHASAALLHSQPAKTSSALVAVIRDFSFAPASPTVTAGQSITWTNEGPTDHTATATDGSFNTGNLHKGQSRTLTFNHAGTFAYICALHPNMRGTLTVKAASSGPTSPGSSSHGSTPASPNQTSGAKSSSLGGAAASTGSAPASDAPAGHGNLPLTGSDTGIFLGVGVLLLWAARLALVSSRGGRLV